MSMSISISIQVLVLAVMVNSGANVALAGSAQKVQIRMHPTAVRELPPEMTRRFSALHSALRPSVRAWVERQARVEAQKGAPNLKALEGTIHSRFPQLRSGGTSAAGSDIEALTFIVMMQATHDMDQDLRSIMGQVKSIDSAKQALRTLQLGLKREIGRSGGKPNTRCRSPFCQSLRARLGKLSASTSNLPRPIRLQSHAEPTYVNLQALQDSIKSQMDSMNEMSEMTSMRLQMAMDRRSKFIETLSNIMKKISETQSSIIQNLK